MTMQYDLLVYAALFGLLAVVVLGGIVVMRIPERSDLETRKVRFAAATFTGILMLFVFAAALYFVDGRGIGEKIFDKAFSGMSPLAGAIVGYLFSMRRTQTQGGGAEGGQGGKGGS